MAKPHEIIVTVSNCAASAWTILELSGYLHKNVVY